MKGQEQSVRRQPAIRNPKSEIDCVPHTLTDTVAASAQLACLLEASAEKPGNVTPAHSFKDMSYEDFLRSAVAIGPEMARAGERAIGETILASVTATRRWTQTNTNLGIILLFAPLAKAALHTPPMLHRSHPAFRTGLRSALTKVLHDLTVADAETAYEAIRLAGPGGFEEPAEHDIQDQPTVTLREAMASALHRDSIAAEYLSDYKITFERGLPYLERALARGVPLSEAIVQVYLELLADSPDTLIARKHGLDLALSVSQDAAGILSLGGIFSRQGRQAIADFDGRLREERGGLNPGTTADLVAATLFVALLEESANDGI
jgi:triphosphoribosyl-dephospho-CoA synthase